MSSKTESAFFEKEAAAALQEPQELCVSGEILATLGVCFMQDKAEVGKHREEPLEAIASNKYSRYVRPLLVFVLLGPFLVVSSIPGRRSFLFFHGIDINKLALLMTEFYYGSVLLVLPQRYVRLIFSRYFLATRRSKNLLGIMFIVLATINIVFTMLHL